jgi:hypothetical protein
VIKQSHSYYIYVKIHNLFHIVPVKKVLNVLNLLQNTSETPCSIDVSKKNENWHQFVAFNTVLGMKSLEADIINIRNYKFIQ